MATTDRAKEVLERLKQYSDEEIAVYRANRQPGTLEVMLADRELERRTQLALMTEQHKLDVKLIAEQVRWMKFSAVLTLVGAVVGAIGGALLTAWLK